MEVYFSNRKLWNGYFKLCVAISIAISLFLFLIYKIIVIIFFIVIIDCLLIYIAFYVSKIHNRLYLRIKKDEIIIYEVYGDKNQKIELNRVKNLNKSGQTIVFVDEDNTKKFIKLKYINSGDAKKLINFLKYHPAIKNKKFFV